jgi:hypothetical protein
MTHVAGLTGHFAWFPLADGENSCALSLFVQRQEGERVALDASWISIGARMGLRLTRTYLLWGFPWQVKNMTS